MRPATFTDEYYGLYARHAQYVTGIPIALKFRLPPQMSHLEDYDPTRPD
jgi:hypothetical protein